MDTRHALFHRRVGQTLLRILVSGALVALLGGCQSLLDVNDPDVIEPGSLESELGLTALRNGAIGDFNLAFNGSWPLTISLVALGGLLADEWDHSGTNVDILHAELRGVGSDSPMLMLSFRSLHVARNSAERAGDQLRSHDPDDPRVAEMDAYAGFTYVLFAEHWCSGVPFSQEVEGVFEFGAPETRVQIVARAVESLDRALSHPSPGDATRAMASVLLGRAILNDDDPDYAVAAASVAAVPTGFVQLAEHSLASERTVNGLVSLNHLRGEITVADQNGGSGLPFRSALDPRVPAAYAGMGIDAVTPKFDLMLYTAQDEPVRAVTGVEARLIEAEWALQDGRVDDMVTILQDLRTWGEANIGHPLATGATPFDFSQIDPAFSLPVADFGGNGIVDPEDEDLLFQERAYWLFSTAHRLGDMRRLIREYGRDVEDVFPVGTHAKGADWGTGVNLPIPDEEGNNPEFNLAGAECLDRLP